MPIFTHFYKLQNLDKKVWDQNGATIPLPTDWKKKYNFLYIEFRYKTEAINSAIFITTLLQENTIYAGSADKHTGTSEDIEFKIVNNILSKSGGTMTLLRVSLL